MTSATTSATPCWPPGCRPDATFTADLRARLAAVASGDIELEPSRPDRSRPWIPLVAAAAVVALVVGAIALIARERDPDVVPASDLRTALVGSTWVALDADTGGDLPMLEMKIGTTRPDVVIAHGAPTAATSTPASSASTARPSSMPRS